jgi:hypothetical protein
MINSEEDKDFYSGYVEFSKKIFEAFEELVQELAREFPDRTIIVRPHPSEDHDSWKSLCSQFDNAFCVYEGGITPWLIGADTVIHNSCTTGVEAFVAGKKVISYQPCKSELYDLELPNNLSTCCDSLNDVVSCIKNSTYELSSNQIKLAQQYVASYQGEPSFKLIAGSICEQAEKLPRYKALSKLPKSTLLTRWKRSLRRNRQEINAYQAQKTQGISLGVIVEKLRVAQRLIGGEKPFSVEEIAEEIYIIYE